MKSCPVCEATTFDDMEICYGCLHRFGEDGSASALLGHDRPSRKPALPDASEPPVQPSVSEKPPDAAPVSYRLEITLVPVTAR